MLTQICELWHLASKSKNHAQDRSDDAPDLRGPSSVCTLSQVFTDFRFSQPARRKCRYKFLLECSTSARKAELSSIFGSNLPVRSRKHSEMYLMVFYFVFLIMEANLVAPEILLERSARSGIPPYLRGDNMIFHKCNILLYIISSPGEIL